MADILLSNADASKIPLQDKSVHLPLVYRYCDHPWQVFNLLEDAPFERLFDFYVYDLGKGKPPGFVILEVGMDGVRGYREATYGELCKLTSYLKEMI